MPVPVLRTELAASRMALVLVTLRQEDTGLKIPERQHIWTLMYALATLRLQWVHGVSPDAMSSDTLAATPCGVLNSSTPTFLFSRTSNSRKESEHNSSSPFTTSSTM